jgi:lipid-binding SYLF domain-containing protein
MNKLVSGAAVLMLAVFFSNGCSSIPVDERAEVREGIDSEAAETLKRMMENEPEFRQKLQAADGCFITRLSTTKVPIIGGGYGMGVLYEKGTGHKTYMNVTRAELGVGLGVGQYRAVVLLEDQETLENFRNGFWRHGIGTESNVGSNSTGVQSHGKGYSVHFVSDAGAGMTASARSVKLSVNEDLTGNAISEFGLPNTRYKTVDDPGESAPRQWGRKLPFMAQKVIDEGYDLPLPFGFSVVYANVEQAMTLNNLDVGINGRPQEPFEFVDFQNAEAHSESIQLKFDAWILPFMNVFAMAGYVEGDAPMDVILNGDDMLDHMEYVCTGPLDPICLLLEGKEFTLPIVAPFSGQTYGIGTTLAGGWNNWFVALPFNATYADMNGTNTDGLALTATPRGGYVFNMGRAGNFALFAGGNYLYTDLTVRGSVGIDDLFKIDYTVEQKNKDNWNIVTGFNWDLNRHMSWSAEYNGYIGSRDAFITSLTWRL